MARDEEWAPAPEGYTPEWREVHPDQRYEALQDLRSRHPDIEGHLSDYDPIGWGSLEDRGGHPNTQQGMVTMKGIGPRYHPDSLIDADESGNAEIYPGFENWQEDTQHWNPSHLGDDEPDPFYSEHSPRLRGRKADVQPVKGYLPWADLQGLTPQQTAFQQTHPIVRRQILNNLLRNGNHKTYAALAGVHEAQSQVDKLRAQQGRRSPYAHPAMMQPYHRYSPGPTVRVAADSDMLGDPDPYAQEAEMPESHRQWLEARGWKPREEPLHGETYAPHYTKITPAGIRHSLYWDGKRAWAEGKPFYQVESSIPDKYDGWRSIRHPDGQTVFSTNDLVAAHQRAKDNEVAWLTGEKDKSRFPGMLDMVTNPGNAAWDQAHWYEPPDEGPAPQGESREFREPKEKLHPNWRGGPGGLSGLHRLNAADPEFPEQKKINDLIDQWHDAKSGSEAASMQLHEWLGMTPQEYEQKVIQGKILKKKAADEGLKAAGVAVIALDTGRVLMQQRALNPLHCPCGEEVTWDEQNGYQHADGSVSHDNEFYGQTVSDLLDQGHMEKESAWERPSAEHLGLTEEELAEWEALHPGMAATRHYQDVGLMGYTDPVTAEQGLRTGNPSGNPMIGVKKAEPVYEPGQLDEEGNPVGEPHFDAPYRVEHGGGDICQDCWDSTGMVRNENSHRSRQESILKDLEESPNSRELRRQIHQFNPVPPTERRLGMAYEAALEHDPNEGTWEFPGGKLDPGESPKAAALREFAEEIGQPLPAGVFVGEWTNNVYRCYIYLIQSEDLIDLTQRELHNPDDPDGDRTEQAAWWDIEHAKDNPALREEVKSTPWGELELWADKSVRSNREVVAMVQKLAMPRDDRFLRNVDLSYRQEGGNHVVDAHLNGVNIGYLKWRPDGTVHHVYVDDGVSTGHHGHQGKGLATEMWNHAEQIAEDDPTIPRPEHNWNDISDDALEWARSMGHTPPRGTDAFRRWGSADPEDLDEEDLPPEYMLPPAEDQYHDLQPVEEPLISVRNDTLPGDPPKRRYRNVPSEGPLCATCYDEMGYTVPQRGHSDFLVAHPTHPPHRFVSLASITYTAGDLVPMPRRPQPGPDIPGARPGQLIQFPTSGRPTVPGSSNPAFSKEEIAWLGRNLPGGFNALDGTSFVYPTTHPRNRNIIAYHVLHPTGDGRVSVRGYHFPESLADVNTQPPDTHQILPSGREAVSHINREAMKLISESY